MCMPDAPTPPNPIDTARAATGTNVGTAVANSMLNNINQITPDGELRYDTTGSYDWFDPTTGTTFNIPRSTATQILSPQGRAIKDQTDATKFNLASIANQQSAKIGGILNDETDFSQVPGMADLSRIDPSKNALQQYGSDTPDLVDTYGGGTSLESRKRVEDAMYQRMQPQLDLDRGRLDQQLADQGIQLGSGAYTSARDQEARNLNDARLGIIQAGGQEQQLQEGLALQAAQFGNQARQQGFQNRNTVTGLQNSVLTDRYNREGQYFDAQSGQRAQELNLAFAKRNQPLNEVAALLSGSQLQNPNFVTTQRNQIPTTDVGGLINQNFAQNMDIYKQQSTNQNQLIGGLLGGFGNILKSDEDEKENIQPMGSIALDGKKLPISTWNYKDDPASVRHIGPMAQDVEEIRPGAVREIGGVKHIDKSKLPARMGGVLGRRVA